MSGIASHLSQVHISLGTSLSLALPPAFLQVHPHPQPSCSLACKAVRTPFLLLLLLCTIYFHVVAKTIFFLETQSNHAISRLKP